MSHMIIMTSVYVNTSLQEGSILSHGGLPPGNSDVSSLCWSIYGFSGGNEQNLRAQSINLRDVHG